MNRNKILMLVYLTLSAVSYVVSTTSDDAMLLLAGNTFAICAAIWGTKED